MHFKYWIPLLIALLLIGCTQKEQKQTAKEQALNPTIVKIVEAHGGLEQWEKQHTLSYNLGEQTQTIDLKSREIKITAPTYSLGNEKGKVWIKDPNSNFQGSPTFHHSLMFYFYAMPFVFADDGIIYKELPDKRILGETYKTLKISYKEGVGDSPEDEYIVYYHPETYKMEWLAYTVTFQSQEDSDDYHLINYKNWEKFSGLLMPTELQWYKYEDGTIGEPTDNRKAFTNTVISEKDKPDEFYSMPEGATIDSAGVN